MAAESSFKQYSAKAQAAVALQSKEGPTTTFDVQARTHIEKKSVLDLFSNSSN